MPQHKEEKRNEEIYKVAERESLERPWASNDKLTYDNTLTHCKALMAQSERIISNAVDFDNSIHHQMIESIQHHRDNDRKTMSYLYDVEIPEGVANAIIVKAAEILKSKKEE